MKYSFAFTILSLGSLVACSDYISAQPTTASPPITASAKNPAAATAWSLVKLTGLWGPTGIALDPNGNIYAAGQSRGVVVKIASDGLKTTLATTPSPGDVAACNGYVYVTDGSDSEVKRIALNGRVTLVGSNWASPQGIACDDSGNLYVTDRGANGVFKVGREGKVTRIRPTFNFGNPYGIAVDRNNNLYVTSEGRHLVFKVPPNGNVTQVGSGWQFPLGIAVGRAGTIFVADHLARKISEIATDGGVTEIPGDLGFGRPYYIAVSKYGRLYVSSEGKNAIFKLTR